MSKAKLSEAEFRVATRKIETFHTELLDAMSECNTIIEDLMENAIKDDKITAKLLQIQSKIALYPGKLKEIYNETNTALCTFIEDVKYEDRMADLDTQDSIFDMMFSVFK